MVKKKEIKEEVSTVAKTTYRVSLGAITLAIIVLILSLYWLLAPVNVLQIKNSPVPVEKKQVKSEDAQVLDISYCKYQDIRGTVSWSLISNKQVILLPPYVDTTATGCNQKLRAPILLPPVKYDDTYHFHYLVTYQVSPLRSETVTFDSQSFVITGLDGQ